MFNKQILRVFRSKRIASVIHLQHIHTIITVRAKLFVDNENKFAHDVLEKSIKPYNIFRVESGKNVAVGSNDGSGLPVAILNPNPTLYFMTVDDMFRTFCELSEYCIRTNTSISDRRFTNFIERYCNIRQNLSDEQLVDTLLKIAQLPPVDSPKSQNYVNLWNNLDVECCCRIEGWKNNQLLLVCDAWYALHLARICEFVTEALRKLGRQVRKMPPEQLVHMMFFCNVVRRPILDMFDFEVNLANCANNLTLQELGVMSMGFFKTQTPIRNPELLDHLYRRLIAEIDLVEDIILVSILKVLRYSSRLPQINAMMQLMDALNSQVDRLSLLSCLHVTLLGSDLQCCNDEVIERILQRFNSKVPETRLKDLERITLVIGMFNFRSKSRVEEDVCLKILKDLNHRVDEIIKHPRCFTNCLHFLSMKGYYDQEMLSSVLDTNFIRHAYCGNMKMGREIFHIDSFVKINLKDCAYEGYQLMEKYRRTMGKMLTNYIPDRKYKLLTTDRILMEIKESTDRIFQANAFKHVLPHFERPDIVICYDNKTRKAIPISPYCPENYSGVILTRKELLGTIETPDIGIVVICVVGWNNVVRGKDRHTGLFDMKIDQLRRLSHNVVLIYWHEWRELETEIDRQNLLKRRLTKVINL